MASKTSIEWTGHTWNPIAGCSVLSPGCTNCYAMKTAARLSAIGQPLYKGLIKGVNGHHVWTGEMRKAARHVLLDPLRRKKPTTYFVNSMSDLFHENVPDEWIDEIFAVMALCPQHTFQVLTKRARRMREVIERIGTSINYLEKHARAFGYSLQWKVPTDLPSPLAGKTVGLIGWPLPNVWLGVSAERQQEADERMPLLLQTPAATRFISAEPLLGPISLRWAKWDDWTDPNGSRRARVDHLDGARMLDWVIVGGESGSGARPMHPDWARALRDQCREAGVPFFFKQWGQWKDGSDFAADAMCVTTDGRVTKPTPDEMYAADREAPLMRLHPTLMRRVSKKAAGRVLDGKLHDAMPERIA